METTAKNVEVLGLYPIHKAEQSGQDLNMSNYIMQLHFDGIFYSPANFVDESTFTYSTAKLPQPFDLFQNIILMWLISGFRIFIYNNYLKEESLLGWATW